MLAALRAAQENTLVTTEGAPMGVRASLISNVSPNSPPPGSPTQQKTVRASQEWDPPQTAQPTSLPLHDGGGCVGLGAELRAKWKTAREAYSHLPKNNGCRGC